MAVGWALGGIYALLFLPADFVTPGMLPVPRHMLIGFAVLMCGWNIVRWRLNRMRRQADEDARSERAQRRTRRDEPPNPDFDFSDPKPGGGPPGSYGPPNGSG
jgi:hypothetical protein